MTTIISRRHACLGFSALAGASALNINRALAASKGGIITWNINNIHNIGGHPAFAIGTPKVINTPAGKALEFDGTNGLILEVNPVAGFENFTIEALIRPDVTAPASRLFHIGEYNNAVDALAPTATNNNSNRFTFETRSAGDQVWFESYNTGPGYASMLLDATKKHPLHTWLVLTQSYDGTMHRCFVNGELQQEKPLKYHVMGPGRCSIGTRLNMTTPFVGGYMRMRFARRALPPEEQMKLPAALKAEPGMDLLHPDPAHKLTRGLGLYDSTMIVAGSMIGSGIFIVGAEMAREVGSAGWMMVAWVMASLLTMAAALSYGELAAMMPRAGGQYVYLREAFSPLWGFLYGWTLFLVIQTGTIAATALGFSRYLGVLVPFISESHYLLGPVRILPGYAISLSTAQVVSLCIMYFVTWTNSRGLKYGKGIQNVFTTAKIGTLIGVILIGLLGWNWAVVHSNFDHAWTPVGVLPPAAGVSPFSALGLFIGLCSAQVGGLYAADAWNNITFTAGEVKNPARNVPLSLALGCIVVMALYILVNLVFMLVLPVSAIQHAPSDRVAASMMDAIFPGIGAIIVAIAIMISAFGCMNGMILSGARAYFAMALDKLFFARAARLNDAKVPAQALGMQAAWVTVLVLMRTYDPATGAYGNLYSSLLDYVVSAGLIFYILTIAGLFRLRKTQPHAERPYKAFGYPYVPAFYIACAVVILAVLFIYRPATTFPGVVIVLIGVPVYYGFRWNSQRLKGRQR